MRRASARRSRTGSSPHTRARPAVGTSTPVSILIVVDLPAPFGPRKPTASPAAMVSVTPSTAVTRFRRRHDERPGQAFGFDDHDPVPW